MYSYMLKTIVYLILYKCVEAGYYSTCEIEGISDYDWGGFQFDTPINDTYHGSIATFKTKNILRMKIEDSEGYLNATWQNQTLTLFTGDKFDIYEHENEHTSRQPEVTIVLSFECTKDSADLMRFTQPILDTNNHAPILNNKYYGYNLGMTIPNKFTLTKLLPIKATDHDITNRKITFSIDENQYFKLDHDGSATSYDGDEFLTKLVALQDINAPFSREFNLTVTDNGNPKRSTFGTINITVSAPEDMKNRIQEAVIKVDEIPVLHPPVFEKRIYYANYTSNHEFKMEEAISIKYGAFNSTILKQIGYEKYFKIWFDDGNHQKISVENMAPLPNTTFETSKFIVIEVEARIEELDHMPGRTVLLIKFQNLNNRYVQNCEELLIFGYSVNNYAIPIVLFLVSVFSIVSINIYLMIMFVNKKNVLNAMS